MKKYSALFVIVAAVLWGVDGIVLRPILFNLPVELVVFLETFLVAAILTPILIRNYSEIRTIQKNDLLAFIGVALFGGALGTMAITKALFYVNFVNLSIVILIQKLQPVFAIILAAVLLKERLPRKFFIWSGIAITGAYFMTFGIGFPDLATGDKTFSAALFALLAAVSFASSTVLSKRALRNVSFELGTYLRFLITSLIMLMIVISAGSMGNLEEITLVQGLTFLLIAFTSGGLAIFLYYFGLKNISASVATIAELAFPLTAVLLEYILRGNILDAVQWMGVLLLIFGIFKVTQIHMRTI